jgi:hypothetical protein
MSEVLTHRGAQIVTRAELARIPTPTGTWSHKPVPHSELVEVLTDRLQERGLVISGEKLAVSANGMQIFGALDFENGIQMAGLGRAMGFHAGNDKSLSINIVAGVRVFVCDNLSLSGSAIVLKRKHTRSLSLASEINLALDRFETGRRVFEQSIERLQGRYLSDDQAKVAIFNMVYTGVLGQSIFSEVSGNYFRAAERNYEDAPVRPGASTTRPPGPSRPSRRPPCTGRRADSGSTSGWARSRTSDGGRPPLGSRLSSRRNADRQEDRMSAFIVNKTHLDYLVSAGLLAVVLVGGGWARMREQRRHVRELLRGTLKRRRGQKRDRSE